MTKEHSKIFTTENQELDQNSLKYESEALNCNQMEARAQSKITQNNWCLDDFQNFMGNSETPWKRQNMKQRPRIQKQNKEATYTGVVRPGRGVGLADFCTSHKPQD